MIIIKLHCAHDQNPSNPLDFDTFLVQKRCFFQPILIMIRCKNHQKTNGKVICFEPRAFQWRLPFRPKIMAFKKCNWSLLISMVLRKPPKTTGNMLLFAWVNSFELKMFGEVCHWLSFGCGVVAFGNL